MVETGSSVSSKSDAIQVMVVDDSAVIRGFISRALKDHSDIDVSASAVNGQDAVTTLGNNKHIEVIVLDIEMPQMNGLEALPELLKILPDVKIIMASTLTQRNADISVKALSLGAVDYVPKPSVHERESLPSFYKELTDKVRALGLATKQKRRGSSPAKMDKASPSPDNVAPSPKAATAVVSAPMETYPKIAPKALAIASSTGGPQALNVLFSQLKGEMDHIPIFITQHMPPTFTHLLANNLSKHGELTAKEGEQGEIAKAGNVYIAPGDYHMMPVRSGTDVEIQLNQDPAVNFCRPAADPMINALSDIYGDRLLVLVLTGMGVDGRDGATYAQKNGATVVAQDEETSVVWGMPGAVAQAEICSAILPLDEISNYLKQVRKQ